MSITRKEGYRIQFWSYALQHALAPTLKPYANSMRCTEQVTLPPSMDEETETQSQGLDSRKRTLLALAVTGLPIYNKAMTH